MLFNSAIGRFVNICEPVLPPTCSPRVFNYPMGWSIPYDDDSMIHKIVSLFFAVIYHALIITVHKTGIAPNNPDSYWPMSDKLVYDLLVSYLLCVSDVVGLWYQLYVLLLFSTIAIIRIGGMVWILCLWRSTVVIDKINSSS